MIDIAKHIRIFNPNPDDDFVTKRSDAIKDIETTYKKKKGIDELMKLANDLVSSLQEPDKLDPSIADIVEKAIKKQSASFIAEGEELQIVSCALSAVLRYLDATKPVNGKRLSTPDILAISLWSGLSFQPELPDKPKLENLKNELIELSRKVVESSALTSRSRMNVQEWKKIQVAEPGNLTEVANIIDSSIVEVIEPLKSNAVLDREEIDLLWWALNDWSEIGATKLSALNDVQIAMVSAIEISKILRRLPARSHHLLAMRAVKTNENYTGHELLHEMGDLVQRIVEDRKQDASVNAFKAVLPVSNLFLSGPNGSNIKRPLNEWSARALLEGTMANFSKLVNDGQ
jgi:hypothetical protein